MAVMIVSGGTGIVGLPSFCVTGFSSREGMQMKRSVIIGVLVLVLAAGSAFAQGDAVLLRYKFTAGQQFKSIETMRGTLPVQMHVEMPGGAQGNQEVMLHVELDTTTIKLMTVREVDGEGVAMCATKIDYMVTDSTTTMGEQVIPSKVEFQDGKLTVTGGGPQDQMTPEKQEQIERLLNTEFTVKVDPLGGVEPVGQDFEKIFSQMMGNALSGVDMRKLSRVTSGLPENPVAVGDSWEVEVAPQEGGGVAEGQSRATLTEIADEGGRRIAKIKNTAHVRMEGLQTPEPGAAVDVQAQGQDQQAEAPLDFTAGMAVKIPFMEMTMTTETAFDVDLGQPVRATGDVTLDMDQEMTIDLAAMLGGEGGDTKINMTTQIRDGLLKMDATNEVLAQ